MAKGDSQLSPQIRREQRLERFVLLLWALIGLIVFIGGIIIAALSFRPVPIAVVDRDTGELIGYYRPNSYRTTDEMITGGLRFLEHHMSLTSNSIDRDTLIALNMMTAELREKRLSYLEKQNLIAAIRAARTRSYLDVDKENILHTDGPHMRIEYIGDIVVTYQDSNDEKRVPFHVILDLLMDEITENNTVGVTVEAYRDF